MAFDPVKIPQNVYVEDRIIGPVTLRHLMILGVGAGISYAIWATVSSAGSPGIPITVLSWSPLGIAAAFAFLKINDLSLFHLILLLIEQSGKPAVRHWTQHDGISVNIITKPPKRGKEINERSVERGASKLAELTEKLEKESREIAMEGSTEERTIQDATPEQENKTSFPVDPTRIEAGKLNTAKSVDGISNESNTSPHVITPS